MSSPKASDMRALKRLGRYLVGRTRYVIRYERQRRVKGISTQVDTDHAGCLRTRTSTSGGELKLGNHVVKTWAHTQSVIALSSGEAEYYGMVKGASYSLGTRSLASDLGISSDQMSIEIFTDSSAARGIASRRGLGKVRLAAVCQLWLQDKVNDGETQVSKTKGTDNQADVLTKHVTASVLEKSILKV